MDNCIFCKLANGEIPTATLYEDDAFRMILDAGPATRGHALILPKAHYANIVGMPPELTGSAFQLAGRMAGRMMEKLGCDGINVVQNNGAAAGQTVFHFHIHLIPRYAGEEPIVAWKPGTLTDSARDELVNILSE